ncbi:DMT family transporter [Phenylobacterium sp.]|uniref:DMT family transporter n=1 Tax=Phenylobacterium sp. TaxID=1871053 RepID=UPI0025F02DDE|nr:DMT family transporter [Phenylobacterium sp.]
MALVLGGVTLFSISDIAAKRLSADLPSLEITWLRYVMLSAVAVAFALRGGWTVFRAHQPRLQLVRGLALLGSASFFLLGLSRLGVAEATAISFVTPALITALSVPLLGETVGVRRWAAVLLGLLGVLVVVRPGGETFHPAAMFSLASAACGALAMVATRRLGPKTRARTTLLWSALTGLALLSLTAPAWFEPPTPRQVMLAAAMGVAYALGQLSMILAYRQAEASLLAPLTYAQLVTSTGLSWVVFAAVPDGVTLGGIAIILASSAYTLHREQVRRRALAAAMVTVAP